MVPVQVGTIELSNATALKAIRKALLSLGRFSHF
jgi:hypothetical protein